MIQATIALLTFDGERYLPQTLQMIERQKMKPLEVIAIDSGSTDSTLDILRQEHQIMLHEIPHSEFSHSRTRNLAARLASGTHVVFLSQDATPADSCWLDRLLAPFGERSDVVASYSRQSPRPDADLLEAADLRREFPSRRQLQMHPGNDVEFRRNIWKLIHFSNAGSAYVRDGLLKQPFNETLPAAEDQEWAKRALEAGFCIAYEPESVILHSHTTCWKKRYARNFLLYSAFAQFLSQTAGNRSLFVEIAAGIHHVAQDFGFIFQSDATIARKLRAAFDAPVLRTAMHLASWKGWTSNSPAASV